MLEIEMDAKLSCLVGGRGARCGFSCILKDAGELESGDVGGGAAAAAHTC